MFKKQIPKQSLVFSVVLERKQTKVDREKKKCTVYRLEKVKITPNSSQNQDKSKLNSKQSETSLKGHKNSLETETVFRPFRTGCHV